MNLINEEGFSHLHVHTDYSLLDGLGNVKDYVARAKELGMNALAFTDHGTMAGLVTAYDECKKEGTFSCQYGICRQRRVRNRAERDK